MKHQIKPTINPVTSLIILFFLAACSPSADNSADKIASQAATQTNIQTAATTTSSEFPYAFEEVANNTWVIHGPRELPNPENKGFMNNPGIVITSAGLVMIDPGSTVQTG